jgi:hypothetical protein
VNLPKQHEEKPFRLKFSEEVKKINANGPRRKLFLQFSN